MSPSAYYDPDIYFEPSLFRIGDYQYPRISALELASRENYRNHVEGAIAEVGVYKGVFASCMNRLFPDRELHLFDTFEGFDDRDIDEKETAWSGEFREVSPLNDSMEEEVLNLIDYERGIIHKGYFPDTTKGIPDKKYAFVSLDTDLYKPIKAGLEYYWPLMANGGYIFVDDYGHKYLQGVNQAVREFVCDHHIGYVRVNDGIDSTAVIQKPL